MTIQKAFRAVIGISALLLTAIVHAQQMQFNGPLSITSDQLTAGIATNTATQIAGVYNTLAGTNNQVQYNVQWNTDGTANVFTYSGISAQSTWTVDAHGNFQIVSVGGSVSTQSTTTFNCDIVQNGNGVATVYVRYSIPVMQPDGSIVNRQGMIPIATVKKANPGIYFTPSSKQGGSVPTIGISTTSSNSGSWVPVSIEQTTFYIDDRGWAMLNITTVTVQVWVATASVTTHNYL